VLFDFVRKNITFAFELIHYRSFYYRYVICRYFGINQSSSNTTIMMNRFPQKQGLYDSDNEHDNCGIGFVANIKGFQTNDIIRRGLQVLVNMTHRGAESSDNKSGDGAGIMMQIPHDFFKTFVSDLPSVGGYGTGLLSCPASLPRPTIVVTLLRNLLYRKDSLWLATAMCQSIVPALAILPKGQNL
jgi:hypothetical protein